MSGPPAGTAADETPGARLRAGALAGIPFGIASFALATSFGVVAHDAGISGVAATVMSAIVFAGASQFATIAIIVSGGSLGAAIVTTALVNSRFLPMGVAFAPAFTGGRLKRALQGQAIVDASWGLAARGDGTFDRWLLFGSTAVQYGTWVAGTAAGAFGGSLLGDTDRFGFDAIYPAFFLALLIGELRHGRALGVAALGAAIALVLVPFAPVGLPVLLASLAALVGLHWRRDA